MNPEHEHVEEDRDQNEADRACDEVLDPQTRRYAKVAEQQPELPDSGKANCRNREQADPFAADDSSE